MLNKANAIPIKSWYSDINDKELLKLLPLLRKLSQVDDVRDHIKSILESSKPIQIPRSILSSHTVKHRSNKIDNELQLQMKKNTVLNPIAFRHLK
mmetsp:Transcript_10556/g.10412  ORF Transcript_10556/g.10412 Transcript_10556/m.10412 type:complete len:95 (+) Transcript_10556:296-580(+)